MAGTYADGTSVAPEKSRAEIERTLQRFGADSFAYGSSREQAIVGFAAHGRQIRIELALPDPEERRFHVTPTGRQRTKSAAQGEYNAEVRRMWRALALVVKAKLEAVESGIGTFEQEFLAYTVLPGGRTVGQEVIPAVEKAYEIGSVEPLMQIGA
jgi:hypothetical protein